MENKTEENASHERNDELKLSGKVQIDDVYYGGERGRGSENKIPFIAAVSINDKGHPIYMNLALFLLIVVYTYK